VAPATVHSNIFYLSFTILQSSVRKYALQSYFICICDILAGISRGWLFIKYFSTDFIPQLDLDFGTKMRLKNQTRSTQNLIIGVSRLIHEGIVPRK